MLEVQLAYVNYACISSDIIIYLLVGFRFRCFINPTGQVSQSREQNKIKMENKYMKLNQYFKINGLQKKKNNNTLSVRVMLVDSRQHLVA